MNMVEASLERDDQGLWVAFADIRLLIPDEVAAKRPDMTRFEGGTIVVGIRPEDIEDAEIESDAPNESRFRTTVNLREALGSEVLVHFTVAAPPLLTEDTKELARDLGMHDAHRERRAPTSTFVARLDPRTGAREREAIELAVDTTRLHFFDPETGLGIGTEGAGGGPPEGEGGSA